MTTVVWPLLGLSEAYAALMTARNWGYDRGLFPSYRSALPVVSIGNITCGGTGKTPLSLYVARELKELGRAPVILSRGYKGSEPGPRRVMPSDTFREVGDEAVLMARANICPVIVSRKRSVGAAWIEREHIGNTIVLDDGFQHRALRRTLDIVSIDVSTVEAVRALVGGILLPAGSLRENLKKALSRTNAVILSSRKVGGMDDGIDDGVKELLRDIPTFSSFLEANPPRHVHGGEALEPTEIGAFCGIANPQGFFQSLVSMGFKVIVTKTYPDHHCFSQHDLNRLYAFRPGLPWVCTDKDAVKLAGLECPAVYHLSVQARIREEAEFRALLQRVLF